MRFVVTPLLIVLLAGCGGGGHASGGGPTPYQVTATAQAGGTISPASASVSTGSTASFVVSVSSGYAVDVASGCGGSLNGNTYTTASVTGNCAITVTFKALDFHVDVTGNGVGGLVIANNTEQLAVDGDGRFTFATGIYVGSAYAVRVAEQPVAQVCRVANGDGVISASVPVAVSVQCVNRIVSGSLLTLRTSLDSSGAFAQFLYVRSPEMDLHQFRIRQSDGGLEEVGSPWSVAPYAQTFVFSGNGARAFADNGVGDVAMATVRESDGVLVPAWAQLFGNYVPVLPELLAPVRSSPDGQILYRNVSFIVGGIAHRDVWAGVVSATGVSPLGPIGPTAFEIGSDGGGPNFDLSSRYFARQVRVSGTIEVYAAFTSTTQSPQLLTQVTKTLPVNLQTSMITEASPGRYLYEASLATESGAAQSAPPQVAVYWWRPDGAFEPLGGALTLGDLTGEIASEVCVGTTTTSRSSTGVLLPATAASAPRYLLQRQETSCTGLGGTGPADSRVLGVYRLTVANLQAALTRMPLDALPGWTDLGAGGAQHPTKPWLYLGSKHAQRVYAYTIDALGAAQPIAGSPFDGQTVPAPTGVAAPSVVMDPAGQYLYMARYSPNPGPTYVDAFAVDQTTGALTPIATYTP